MKCIAFFGTNNFKCTSFQHTAGVQFHIDVSYVVFASFLSFNFTQFAFRSFRMQYRESGVDIGNVQVSRPFSWLRIQKGACSHVAHMIKLKKKLKLCLAAHTLG